MGLSVSNSMFENSDILRNTAKSILNKGGNSKEVTSHIINNELFTNDINESAINSQMSIVKASIQISLSNSLKETLKYLKTHANKTQIKKHIFGEIWNIVNVNNDNSENKEYNGELIYFEIDKNKKNIFAA